MKTLNRQYYVAEISKFLEETEIEILGKLSLNNEFALDQTQKEAWRQEIEILKNTLSKFPNGQIFFEFSIPRMGSRIDVILIIRNAVFVIEFKVGEKNFLPSALDQVWDYAIDLKNFHKTSHDKLIAPILVATAAEDPISVIEFNPHNDNLLFPIKANATNLLYVIENVISQSESPDIDAQTWILGKYSPTPTIIEAAMALYNNHSVEDITKNEAEATNLVKTSAAVHEIIHLSKLENRKSICFVTGVPGAGKTLVGLDIATRNMNKDEGCVFLSGNGPLVAILREALTRDRYKKEKALGKKVKKGEIYSNVKAFIQNVHHFRDEYLRDTGAPFDHVAIFDEAQRAWNKEQTISFMQRKKNFHNFSKSEPEFLINCLDRHKDWAVVVCLVGGGQEINTGEAGISEWIESMERSFKDWDIHISPHLTDSEYSSNDSITRLKNRNNVYWNEGLHLSVSMRSFRAEHLSTLVKNLLDQNIEESIGHFQALKDKYPIVITRNLLSAKRWLKMKARGSERYGIIVSSQAQRLKPFAIDVKSPIDPIHWFLDGKDDVRSSYYLEDVATEFHVQGLELDWACVTWDGDFRFKGNGEWQYFSFKGDKWQNINKEEKRKYLKNAYRVLLTRARQGMVIVVPEGNDEDHTRKSSYYDSTFRYLISIGFQVLE